MRAPLRWLAIGLAAGALLGAGRAASEPHWLDLAGPEWRAMSAEARRAWLQGFLAGAATEQAIAAGATDSLALRTGVEALRRGGQLQFPYGPDVYGARLGDYYFYETHQPLPIWFGAWEINHHLARHRAEPGR